MQFWPSICTICGLCDAGWRSTPSVGKGGARGGHVATVATAVAMATALEAYIWLRICPKTYPYSTPSQNNRGMKKELTLASYWERSRAAIVLYRGSTERYGSSLPNFELLGVSGTDLECTWLSRTVAQMMVFALWTFYFELLIVSSPLDVLHSP